MFGSPKKSGIKGLRVIYEQLERAVRANKGNTSLVPQKYASYNAEELYYQFLKVAPDVKGLLSSSYGATGWAVSFEFYMDFVNFVVPGILAIPIGGSVTPKRMDTAMLVIHRVNPLVLKSRLPVTTPSPTTSNGTTSQNASTETASQSTSNGAAPATGENSNSNSENSQAEDSSEVDQQAIWQSSYPVCFNAFLGRYWQLTAKAGFQAFFALSPADAWSGKKDVGDSQEKDSDTNSQTSTSTSGLNSTDGSTSGEKEEPKRNLAFAELPLGLGISMGAELKLEYSTLFVADPAPGWYPSSSDQGLKLDFSKVLSDKTKGRLKLEIMRWIRQISTDMYVFIDAEESTTDQVLVQRIKNKYLAIAQRKLTTNPPVPSPWRKAVKKKFMSFFGSFYDQVTYITNKMEKANLKSSIVIEDLQKLVKLLPGASEINAFAPFDITVQGLSQEKINERNTEKARMTEEIGKLETQAKEYIRRLTAITNNNAYNKAVVKTFSRPLEDFTKYLSFLKVGGHSGGLTPSLSGIAGPATANAVASASIKGTGYRYQTFAPGDNNRLLIYTQDTRITYRQVELKADASLGFLAEPTLYEKRPKILNGMTYRSACCYWLYPKGDDPTETEEGGDPNMVKAEVGSGVSFGAFLYVKEINALVKDIRANQGKPNSMRYKYLINTLSNDLKIPKPVIINFFNNDFFAKLTKDDIGGINSVLFESSWRVNDGYKIPLYERNNSNKKLPVPVLGLKKQFGSLAYSNFMKELTIGSPDQLNESRAQYLDAIRIRVRMADYEESSVNFKIGPHAVLAGSGGSSGITLSYINEVGQEGVIDLYTVKFGAGYVANPSTATSDELQQAAITKSVNEGPDLPIDPQIFENGVPPVALLHQ